MESKFDYQSVPAGYAHCFNHQCARSEACLRHLVAVNCTERPATITVVNPLRIPSDASACPYFKKIETIRVAWGVKHLYEDLPYNAAKDIKKEIIAHFRRNAYYRLYRRESVLTPKDQEFIRQVFIRNNITEEPKFDTYADLYNYFN